MYFWILLEMKSAIKGEQAWKEDRNNVNLGLFLYSVQQKEMSKNFRTSVVL